MGPSRLRIHVSKFRRPEQAVTRRNKRFRAVGGVGPAVADWLFAFSITNNVMGGNFVYVVLLALVCIGLYVAAQLPRRMWTRDSRWIPLT
jgi:hypothetical protein